MGVKLNRVSASDRQCVLTPLEAFPSFTKEGTSGFHSLASFLLF